MAIGFLNAAGIDLGNVKIAGDLGKIVVGDPDVGSMSLGLNSLKVASLGQYGLDPQGGAGDLASVVTGPVGSLEVKGNVYEASLTALTINTVIVGGWLVGGASAGSGRIFTDSEMGNVTIKGDIVGGTGNASGQISSGGNIGKVVVGGSLLGANGGDVNTNGSGSIISGR